MNLEIYLFISSTQSWVLHPDQEEGREIFNSRFQILSFMMACDVGWTGIIFETRVEGVSWAWCIMENPKHIVDVRSTYISESREVNLPDAMRFTEVVNITKQESLVNG